MGAGTPRKPLWELTVLLPGVDAATLRGVTGEDGVPTP